jgi:multidrug resistance efflux pump
LVLIAVVAVAALLCVPWTYRLDCRCEVQPVIRRVVAAPFDGKLLGARVEPGDVVRVGQTLAVLDGREVRWELAGIVAEHSRAGKERDGHFAEHDFGAARLAELEQERLAHRQRLLEDRTANLEVRSPSDGVIIAGDLKKFEGKPLETGETLFEVAPLGRMRIEIEVPEDQVRHVTAGQPVTVALEAFPGRRWTGHVARIHPRAETRDDRYVFIAEVELPNDDALLRPGMRGEAHLAGPRRSLGWCLFHRPLAKLLFWLGW